MKKSRYVGKFPSPAKENAHQNDNIEGSVGFVSLGKWEADLTLIVAKSTLNGNEGV